MWVGSWKKVFPEDDSVQASSPPKNPLAPPTATAPPPRPPPRESVKSIVLEAVAKGPSNKGPDGAGMTVSPGDHKWLKTGLGDPKITSKSDKNLRGIDFDQKKFAPK